MHIESGSLIRLRVRGRSIDIVPLWSVIAAFGVLLLLVAVAVIVERRVFPRLERDRMLPSARWERETETINANNRGKIITDDPVWKSKGFPVTAARTKAHRILVAGDSFAWAAALDNMNDVWWRQLQRELERRGYHDVEVIAACAAGASTRQELELVRAVVPKYKPDLVIWGYVTNDPDEGLLPQLMTRTMADVKIAEPQLRRVLEFVAPTFPMIAYRVDALRGAKREVLASNDRDGLEYAAREMAMLQGPNFARYRQTLSEVAAFHEQAGIPGFFITLPNFASNEYFVPRYAPVAQAVRAVKLPFYDTLPAFVERYGESPILRFSATPNDGHPGPISTHFFADRCATILERDYAAVIGARSPAPHPAVSVNDWAPFDLAVQSYGSGDVVLDYPSTADSMLRMPAGEPFVQLNFAEPVRLSEIRVEGKYLSSARVAWTKIDEKEGFDQRRPKSPQNAASPASFRVPGDKVNTVRLTAAFVDEKQMPVETHEESLVPPFQKEAGFSWSYALPHLDPVSDSADHGTRSVLQLLEDGRPIGMPHSAHVDIQSKGGGLYSHWHTRLFFSTPDHSDPSANGRRYSIRLVKVPEDARRVRIAFVRMGGAP